MKFVLSVWLISKASMAITSAQFDDLEKVPRGLAHEALLTGPRTNAAGFTAFSGALLARDAHLTGTY